MQGIPAGRLIGEHGRAAGDALADHGDCIGLGLDHEREGTAATLAHRHHDLASGAWVPRSDQVHLNDRPRPPGKAHFTSWRACRTPQQAASSANTAEPLATRLRIMATASASALTTNGKVRPPRSRIATTTS